MSNSILLTTDHLAVTTLEPPNTATRSHVDVMNTFRAQHLCATNVVDVIRVTTVDDHVVRSHLSDKFIKHRVDQRGRNHQPDRARRLELRDKTAERRIAGCTLVDKRLHGFRIAIVNNTLVTAAQQASHHVGAHAAEPNHSDLHEKAPLLSLGV